MIALAMEIVSRVSRMSSLATKIAAGECKIGLVPTMGSIHPGHLSLIQTARKMTDVVVVSIFVNRLQFLSEEEYRSYPRDITADVDRLKDESVDYIFTPPEEEMYPAGFSTYVVVESYGRKLPELQRSTYLRGMTTSVVKMLNIVKPACIFFGQKDGLQGAILQKMMRDLDIATEVVVRPVVRDASGLAFAARNLFLSEPQKVAAAVIYASLQSAEALIRAGETQTKKIVKQIASVIESEPLARPEYSIVADPATLEPVTRVQGKVLLAVGARIGETSLNDSVLVEPLSK
jgi:pantoate--beta-alanine ligase